LEIVVSACGIVICGRDLVATYLFRLRIKARSIWLSPHLKKL
jgi:hypothetical protein